MEHSIIKKDLLSRGCTLTEPGLIIDEEKNVATFIIYDVSGGICGYQQYNPRGAQNLRDPSDLKEKDRMKYYTHAVIEGDENKKRGKKKSNVWGFHTINYSSDVVFIVEGIFDAVKIHECNFSALAVLGNDPIQLKSLFYTFHQNIIAILDNDQAGAKLAKLADISYSVPKPFKDIGEMSKVKAQEFLIECYEKL